MSRRNSGDRSRPATPAEREMWLAVQLADDATAFTTAHTFRFDGRLDATALARGWDLMVRAVPHLSARFIPEGAELSVVFADHAPGLAMREVSGLDEMKRATERMRTLVLDATTGPLCQAELLRRTDTEEDTLVVAVSHLIADGFAWSILLSTLGKAYEAQRSGDSSTVWSLCEPEAPMVSERSEEWAARNMAALPHPSRRPLPVRQARPRAVLPLPRSIRMGDLPHVALAAAAFAALRAGGRGRVVVDVPFFARAGSQLRMASTAMNVVPIAVDTSADDAAELLARCAESLAEAGRNAAARTEHARRRHVADGAPPPVADIALNIIPFSHELVLDGMAASVATLSSGPGDVSAIAVRATTDGRFRIEADAETSDNREAERLSRDLAERFAVAFEALCEGRLPTVSPERNPAYPAPDVVGVIAERVRDQPSSPAFIGGMDGFMTYRQLWEEAEIVAERIVKHALNPESRVGVCASRGAKHAAGVLGVLLAGAAFVPLPSGPEEAISRRRIAAAVGLDLVLADEDAATAGLEGIPRIVLGNTMTLLKKVGLPSVGRTHAHPDQLAYVIATSGSTGAPKPVAVSRGALSGWTRSILRDYLTLGPDDRVAQFAAVQFDASIEELFPALCNGAALMPRSPRALESVRRWLEECGDAGATVLDLPTGYWHELTRALALGQAHLPASVHTVIIGGEAASPEHVRQWRSHVDARVKLVNTYGPTEATVVATRHVLAGAVG